MVSFFLFFSAYALRYGHFVILFDFKVEERVVESFSLLRIYSILAIGCLYIKVLLVIMKICGARNHPRMMISGARNSGES